MPETTMGGVIFEESQRVSPPTMLFGGGLVVLALGGAAIGAAAAGELAKAGPGLLFGAVISLSVLLLVGLGKVETRVTMEEVVVAYRPWKTLRLRGAEIGAVAMTRFGLFSGGIGYHVGPRSMAITARTGDGVLVTRGDGRRILIGTGHPEALYSALLRLQASSRGA